MSTLKYIQSRLERPLNEEDTSILKKLVPLNFNELQLLLQLHSNLFNYRDKDKYEGWAERTAEFEKLIGLAVDYKYYEIFNTTFSDIVNASDYDAEYIEIAKTEGPPNLDSEFTHLEDGILYGHPGYREFSKFVKDVKNEMKESDERQP